MFTFLGTSAGEQFPGVWCACPSCQEARARGGRNIRRNSCAAVGTETLIDFGPSIPVQTQNAGIPLPDVETLLVTHGHEDHYTPWYLRWRQLPVDQAEKMTGAPNGEEFGPLFSRPPLLTIYGNAVVAAKTEDAIKGEWEDHHLKMVVIEPWKRYETAHLAFYAVPANHDPGQDCYNYVLEYKGRWIFYASDTAWFLPETQEFLKQFSFDVVAMEGTFGYNNSYDATQPGHCNFHVNRQARQWMEEHGMLRPGAVFAITHTGPHHAPPYEETAPKLAEWGLTLAYDGMKLPVSET